MTTASWPHRKAAPWAVVRVVGALAAMALAAGCDRSVAGSRWEIEFPIDVAGDAGVAREAFICSAFAVEGAATRTVRRIDWQPPHGGGVILHHAKLYAVPAPPTMAAWACDAMPDGAVALHVWTPGSTPLIMPADVALALPPQTRSLIVEAHAVRVDSRPAPPGRVIVDLDGPAAALAGWTGAFAPVPPLRPRVLETSTALCSLGRTAKILFALPHMHLSGREFHARLLAPDGSARPLVDVPVWDFHDQRLVSVDASVDADTRIELSCLWRNPGPDYVLPGPRTVDEMCQLGLMVSPPAAAPCPPPP